AMCEPHSDGGKPFNPCPQRPKCLCHLRSMTGESTESDPHGPSLRSRPAGLLELAQLVALGPYTGAESLEAQVHVPAASLAHRHHGRTLQLHPTHPPDQI